MTHQPGTADIFTTDDPPFPAPDLNDLSTSEERTPYGWTLRHVLVDSMGTLAKYRTDVYHPWLGRIGTIEWIR